MVYFDLFLKVILIFCIVLGFFVADTTIQKAIIAGIGAFLIVFFQHRKTREREITARFFDEKKEAYGLFSDLVFQILSSEVKKNIGSKVIKISNEDLAEKIMQLKHKLQLWGDYSVLAAWYDFEKSTGNPNEVMDKIDGVFMAIRKELGHDDSKMPSGFISTMFVTHEDREQFLNRDQ